MRERFSSHRAAPPPYSAMLARPGLKWSYTYEIPCQQPPGADCPDIHQPAARRARRHGNRRRRRNAGNAVLAGARHHSAPTSTWRTTTKAPSARTPACRPSSCTRRWASTRSRSRRRFAKPWRKPRGWASCVPIRWIRSPARTAATTWAPETPVIHFEQWEEDEIEVKLILKGGGCENKNIQYSVPCEPGSPGPRRPQPGRRAQVHSARRVAGAGARLRAGRARRLHRQRPRARLRAGQGPALPHARRRESRSRAGQAGSGNHGGGQPAGRGRDGLRRQSLR